MRVVGIPSRVEQPPQEILPGKERPAVHRLVPTINEAFKQAQHAWKTFKYWQSQSQQTGTRYGNQAQQVKAAWKAWKFIGRQGQFKRLGPISRPRRGCKRPNIAA